MKIYISADIEGVTGIAHWDEARKSKADYPEFRRQMTQEVVAACEGAIAAGATEIMIKDAHASGRNIVVSEIPDCARLIRGWSGHPLCMVQELDDTYDAVILIGYHSRAGSEDNPLAHTLSGQVDHIKLNGEFCSEFRLHTYAALMFGVPVAFVSGDGGLCKEVVSFNQNIRTLAVNQGIGNSAVSIAPRLAIKKIKEGVHDALKEDLSSKKVELPKNFELEIRYSNPVNAYKASYYPGAAHIGQRTVRFEAKEYFEILRMLLFTT